MKSTGFFFLTAFNFFSIFVPMSELKIGTAIEKVLKVTRIDRVAKAIVGESEDCGCQKRRDKLDSMFKPKTK